MAKDVNAIFEGNAGSGTHKLNLTVNSSTAWMELISPPYSQSGASTSKPSYVEGASVAGASVAASVGSSVAGSVGGSVTTGGASVAVAGAPPQAVRTLAITRSDNKTNRLRFTFLLLREILIWIQLRAVREIGMYLWRGTSFRSR